MVVVYIHCGMLVAIMYKACQSNAESWKRSDEEMDRAIDKVTIKSFNFSSIQSVILAKLENSSSQKSSILKYKGGTGSNGNLIPVNMFKVLFLETAMAELAKYTN